MVESFNSLNTTLVDNGWVEVDEPGHCGCLLDEGLVSHILTDWIYSHDTLSSESSICQPQVCY